MTGWLIGAALAAAPVNPYLAASNYALPHRSWAQQDSTPIAGPNPHQEFGVGVAMAPELKLLART
jgi:hypothetical protein